MFDNRDDKVYLLNCIEKMVVKWFGYRRPWFGIDEKKISNTVLPEPLQWIYRFAGEWPARNDISTLFSTQDVLVPFELLQNFNGKLFFAAENQGIWLAGTDSEGEDPPVYVCGGRDDDAWTLLHDSLTEFLVTMCLQGIVFGSCFRSCRPDILDEFKKLGCHVSPLWLDGPFVNSSLQPTKCSFHVVDEDFLVMNNYWCGAARSNAWEKHPLLFDPPKPKSDVGKVNVFVPPKKSSWESVAMRKSRIEYLIKEHQKQADHHVGLVDEYQRLVDAIDRGEDV